jgi:2-polyprenyl-3-methyl-5-hydroxy-6-metoxy-1,4-benzoquinol methylase
MKGIRDEYQEEGVENYYLQHGSDYENPHFDQVRQLLMQNEERIDYSQVLDLSCGSGEVSLVLKELGYADTQASDPYTQEAYTARLGKSCQPWSFEDIVKGCLEDQYSSIICSFAMHLCAEDLLFPLVYQLFQHTARVVVITPHKRPELEKLEGVSLAFDDFALTSKGKKVRLKAYQATFTRH